ncbi:hypothetical protein BR93DRAFT_980178 [Coniochaeta sp. PMI_546]|nr:hypothetical protein BR93DRAFT_980178 [Coniochaeta sp. PMI_546]
MSTLNALSRQNDNIFKFLTDHRQPKPPVQPVQGRKKPGLHVRVFTLPKMGGSAFTSDPYLLNTPRMPPAIYHKVKSACHACLRELYVCVASPIEGPGKEDHGDVDIVVAFERQALFPSGSGSQLPHPRTGYEPFKMIAAALGAEHVIYLKPHLVSANMAIPWPRDDNDTNGFDQDTEAPPKRRHIQVDIHIAPSYADFQWRLFRHAHGDFFQIVGTIIRSLGLTVDEHALWIRIPEIETRDRKKAKIFLTSDPVEVLEFLGYKGYGVPRSADDTPGCSTSPSIADDDTGDTSSCGFWERPFNSVKELFEYATTCRWFWASPPEAEEDGHESVEAKPENETTLRSNDRRRMKQRPVYQQWAEEYIPSIWQSVRDGTFSNQEFNLLSPFDKRMAVREAAFERWPEARVRYMEHFHSWHLQIAVEYQEEDILSFIKETVAMLGQDVNWYNVAVKALKKIVFSGDSSFGFMPLAPLRDSEGLYDVIEAKQFVSSMCWHVGEAAWKIMCAKGERRMKHKARRKEFAKLKKMDKEALQDAMPMLEVMGVEAKRLEEQLEKKQS